MGPWSPPSHSSILCPGPLGHAWWTVVSAPPPAHLVGCWDPSRPLPCRAHFALRMPSRASLSWWRMMCPAWPSAPGAHTRHSLPPLCRAPNVLPLPKCAAPPFEMLFPQSLPYFLNHLQTNFSWCSPTRTSSCNDSSFSLNTSHTW